MTLAGMGLLSQDDGIPASKEEEDAFQPPVIDPSFLADYPGGIPAALAEHELEIGDFYGSPASLAPFSIDDHDLGPEVDIAAIGPTSSITTEPPRASNHNKDDDNSLPSSSSVDKTFTFSADQADFLTASDVSSFSVEPIHMTGTPSNKDTTMARSSLLSGSGPKLGSTTCSCIITAVSINEAIQVDLNGGESAADLASEAAANASGTFPSPGSSPSMSSTIYQWTFASSSQNIDAAPTPLITQMVLLQRQKTALARFEPLLSCAACWSRSDFVMLMITMCERVLASLDKIVLGQQQQQRSHFHQGISTTTGQQIDEDDELELVISLLKSRMARLHNLLALTEGAVNANGWPSHGRITQGLRRRFNELLFSLSFRGLH